MVRPRFARVVPVALSIVLVLSVLAPFVAGPAAALVQGNPNVSLSLADNSVAAGESTTLEVAAVNRGDLEQGSNQGNVQANQRVTTARGVTLQPSSNGPITVETNEVALGSLQDGAVATGGIQIAVAEGADPGTYDVPVDVVYRYTSQVSEQGLRTYQDETVTRERDLQVVVDEDARLEVVGVDAVGPGESGTFALDVTNTGDGTANDAVVGLSSLTGAVQFGAGGGGQAQAGQGGQTAQAGQGGQTGGAAQGSQAGQGGQAAQAGQGASGQGSANVFVEEWQPGENRTLLFHGSVDENAPVTEMPASLSAEYTDDAGVAFDSESTFGFEPSGDQTFSFEPDGSDLRVGQEGTVRGTFTNEGPSDVENVVVTLEPPGRNAEVLEPELALGDLDSGESTQVAFEVEMSGESRAGPRQFSLSTDYQSADGDDLTADAIRFRETVEPSRDVLDVEATEQSVGPGETDRLVLAVTNNQSETVTDVSAQLFASQPLSADDDEAFVSELEPDETVEVPFRISAAGSAMNKDYPVSVDFQYVDASGETRLTDTYRVPVTVESSDGGFFGIFGLLGVAGVVGATALAVPLFKRYRRR